MGKVQVLGEAVRLCGAAGITPFIWGERGMGKSSIVKQLAAKNNMGFVDMRCSQMEASDLRGLPDRVDGRTVYLPPAEMPVGDLEYDQTMVEVLRPFRESTKYAGYFKGCNTDAEAHTKMLELVANDRQAERIYKASMKTLQPRFATGIIFLDELNRAQDDVQQAAFQFVLDREIGSYVLPPGWYVVVAGNYNEGYQVSGFNDPAFLDRFCHLTFDGGEATMEDWIQYMAATHGADATDAIEFASQNPKHLDGELKGELGFAVQPSRRSWESVTRVRVIAERDGFHPDIVTEVIAGLIGRELAIAFSKYNCPVKPRMIMKEGVSRLKKELNDLNRGQIVGLVWGLVASAVPQAEDDTVAEHCLDFADWLARHKEQKDLAVAFCRAMVSAGASPEQERSRVAVISNPKLAHMIAKYATGKGKKTFIDRLNSRPDLQKLVAATAWGSD